MRMSHWTGPNWTYDPRRTYRPGCRKHAITELGFKPNGFWLSVDGHDDWAGWCLDNLFNLDRLYHRHEFKVRRSMIHSVLWIESERELEAFNAEYAVNWKVRAPLQLEVDWPRLRERYSGIVIAPHQVNHRLDPDYTWYSTWDCSSACFWDLKALRYVRSDWRHNHPVDAAREKALAERLERNKQYATMARENYEQHITVTNDTFIVREHDTIGRLIGEPG